MAKREPPGQGQKPPEQADVYTLTDLEQVKVLADPLRVRILEALGPGEFTTKQVAQQLGEKPTRLYHHVEALERVGLVRLSRTQQVRGTVEKYYIAVARTFRADSGLFHAAGDSEKAETLAEVVNTMMDNTAADLRRLVRAGHDIGSGEESILSFFELRASEQVVLEVRDRLMALLKELESKCCREGAAEGDRRYRFTLAYFPLDRSDPRPK
jgi:DNA-binding transcriptional ArsR family regulator